MTFSDCGISVTVHLHDHVVVTRARDPLYRREIPLKHVFGHLANSHEHKWRYGGRVVVRYESLPFAAVVLVHTVLVCHVSFHFFIITKSAMNRVPSPVHHP